MRKVKWKMRRGRGRPESALTIFQRRVRRDRVGRPGADAIISLDRSRSDATHGVTAMKATPQVLKGTRDFLPQRMILRHYVTDELRRVFERFGFEPLQTPAIEYAETLKGKYGDEADKLIYDFEDRGGRDVGLRYDLTVPLARVISMYPDLVKPFKRYQI